MTSSLYCTLFAVLLPWILVHTLLFLKQLRPLALFTEEIGALQMDQQQSLAVIAAAGTEQQKEAEEKDQLEDQMTE